MKSNVVLERIYKRLLKESTTPNVDGYGAYVTNADYGNIKTVVYDIPNVEDLILDNPQILDNTSVPTTLINHVIAWINIRPADDPCWDAYEIGSISGPGKLAYALAYATSPSGRLISDRESMTIDAISAWKNMSSKSQRNKLPLDPVDNPKTPNPDDDCKTRKEDFLNYAYEAEGWEKSMLDGMTTEHNDFMSRLSKAGIDLKSFENLIRSIGFKSFQSKYEISKNKK